MNLLPKWVLTNPHPSIYDVESGTATEMVAKVYGAMNELIAEYNKMVDEVNKQIIEHQNSTDKDIDCFKKCVTETIENYIKSIDIKMSEQDSIIKDAVDYMKTNLVETVKHLNDTGELNSLIQYAVDGMLQKYSVLNSRMDTLVAGSNAGTEGNSELLDIRVGADGTVYESAGESVRQQFKSIKMNTKGNLINPNRVTDGYYVNESTGQLVANNTYMVTHYIPVISGSKYSLSQKLRFAWYDENRNYISGENSKFNGNAPENAKFIRISIYKENFSTLMFTHSESIPAEYIPFYIEFPELKVTHEFNRESLIKEGAYIKENLFYCNSAIEGKYVDENTGALVHNADYFSSEFIECEPNTNYVTNLNYTRVAAYDSNYCFIVGAKTPAGTPLMTPENAKYFRVSHQLKNKESLMIVQGDIVPDYYIPYKIVLPWLYTGKSSKYEGKIMVCFGDSITYSGYTDIIKQDTGIEAINVGMESARYAYADDETTKNNFALHNIIDSVCTGNWTIPNKIQGDSLYLKQYAQIELLKEIDFGKVDFVSFAYGTNDYRSATPLDNKSDLYDVNTVLGALRYSIKTLLTKYPHLKIIVSLPIYRFFTEGGVITSDGDTKDWGGGTLAEYCNAIASASKSMHIPFVDCYNNGGINEFNRLEYFKITDGTHPVKKGLDIIGRSIASGVLQYL